RLSGPLGPGGRPAAVTGATMGAAPRASRGRGVGVGPPVLGCPTGRTGRGCPAGIGSLHCLMNAGLYRDAAWAPEATSSVSDIGVWWPGWISGYRCHAALSPPVRVKPVRWAAGIADRRHALGLLLGARRWRRSDEVAERSVAQEHWDVLDRCVHTNRAATPVYLSGGGVGPPSPPRQVDVPLPGAGDDDRCHEDVRAEQILVVDLPGVRVVGELVEQPPHHR